MFAVSRSLELLDDFGDLVQISFVQRTVRTDRKTDPVRRQRDTADQIINRGSDRASSIKTVIDGDLEDVEIGKVVTRPLVNRRVIRDANRRIWPACCQPRSIIARALQGERRRDYPSERESRPRICRSL